MEHFAHPSPEAAAGAPEQLWINYGATPDVMVRVPRASGACTHLCTAGCVIGGKPGLTSAPCLTRDPSQPAPQVVGWLTSDASAASTVEYGTSSGSYTLTASGTADQYVYSSKYTSGLIHHVPLTGLKPATRYFYRAGSATAWSAEASFVSSPGVGADIPHTFGYVELRCRGERMWVAASRVCRRGAQRSRACLGTDTRYHAFAALSRKCALTLTPAPILPPVH